MTLLPQRGRVRLLVVAVVAVLAAVVATIVVVTTRTPPPTAAETDARSAAATFFARWVDGDGRVVRRDQGGDTVSEGQAYGLLLAVATGDRQRFDTVWTWTRDNLQRSDKLFSYLWKDGTVADPTPAADADVDTAWALLQAGKRFRDPSYTAAGRSVAQAVLQHETVDVSTKRVLVGGPWATTAPYTVNPSYLVGGVAAVIAADTGSVGWRAVAAGETDLDAGLVGAKKLPPDWARLDQGAALSDAQPTNAPDGSHGPGYNLDAPRLIVRLAASCTPADRGTAASASPLLGDTGAPTQRNVDGSDAGSYTHPLSDVAVAAAAAARGDAAAVRADLATAARTQQRSPTYYGGAWVALGRVMLTTDWLGTCSPVAGKQ